MGEMIAKAGFYDGKFRKAGQFHSGPASDDIVTEDGSENSPDLDGMTKDQLIAEAERRGVEVRSSDTKAEIVAALRA